MHGLVWFLAITFGLAWGSWEAAIASGVSVLSWQFQLYALPGAFAPAIAAIVVRRWLSNEGFGDAELAPRLSLWRHHLFAWLLPLGVVAAIVTQAAFFGIAEPDFTLTRAAAAGVAGRDAKDVAQLGWLVVPQVMLLAVVTTPLLWGEEFGWRGYFQRRILPGRPVGAAVITGIVWAIWHYPLTLRGYNYPDQPLLGSLLFVAIAICNSYIFEWFRKRTGSIWAASLAHASANAIGGLATLWFAGAIGPIVASYAGLLAVPPLLGACFLLHLLERAGAERRTVDVRTEASARVSPRV